MTRASLDRSFDWTRQRLRHDGGLLLTVALALIGAPAMLLQVLLALAPMRPMPFLGQTVDQIHLTSGQWIAFAALLAALVLGGLTITRMLMTPGETVRASLDRAGRRLPALLGAQVIATVVVTIALILIAALAIAGGHLSAVLGALLLLLALAFIIVVAARLSVMAPAAVEGGGPLAVLGRTVKRGQGHTLALVLLMLVTLVVTLIVVTAAQALFGIPVALVGGGTAGKIAGGAAAGLVYAVAALVTAMLLVGLYRQFDSGAVGSGVDEGDVPGD